MTLVPLEVPSIPSAVLTGCFAIVFYAISLVIYRLTFHPLAKYPGPFLAKISDVDNIYWTWKGERHLNFLKCHDKYGPVYRLGPNQLSFNTAKSLTDIYGPKANVQKATYYNAFVAEDVMNVFNTIDKRLHAKKRRIMQPAFSERALKSMEGSILDHIRKWCAMLKENGAKGTLNMAHLSVYLSFDVMGELAFGRSFNMLGGENRAVEGLMESASIASHLSGSMISLHKTGLANLLLGGTHARGKEEFSRYALQQATERSKLGEASDKTDFFHYLIQSKDPETGEKLSMQALWGEATTFIIAGSDTSSTTLAGTFFYLARYPEVRAIVREEVRKSFDNVEDIKIGPSLNSCVYLRACIDETLRLAPPVPGMLPREVLSGGTTIDGHHIPEGIEVGIGHFALMHSSEYYDEPFRYKPERWIIKDESDERKKRGVSRAEVEKAQSAFCAFSIGPRSCVGKNMAYYELTLALARVLFLFDFESGGDLGESTFYGEEEKPVWKVEDQFVALKQGPLIKFTESV